MKNTFLLLLSCLLITVCRSQTITPNDGDWSLQYVTLLNTPEAEIMVRTGDIDNLGFGWPINFDPFSGYNTPVHPYPWTVDATDPAGTDRIMVISSYTGGAGDGYTSTTSRPANAVHPITLSYTAPATITAAKLQFFSDDFQSPTTGSMYRVYLDGVRSSGLENIINNLNQTGPIGKMVTYTLPQNLLPQLLDGQLEVLFDDSTTGAGDGYAIDFVKLLINPSDTANTHTYLYGTVTDAVNNNPLTGVVVSTSGSNATAVTDAAGHYLLSNVTPGIVQLTTFKSGYGQANSIISLQAGDSISVDFQLLSPAPQLIYSNPYANETYVDTQSVIRLVFDQSMDISTFNASYFTLSDTVQNIPGSFSASGDTLLFTPSQLHSETDYTILIYHNLKSANGVYLAQDIPILFSTHLPTGISETEKLPLSIYPNPVKDRLTCKSPQQLQAATLSIKNILGKEVLHFNNISGTEVTIDVGFLPAGVYVVQIDSDGKRFFEKFLHQ